MYVLVLFLDLTKMENKSAEEVISGASIMTNVWEIRFKEYSQKQNTETERLEKSALEK